jgi:putative transposase
VTRKQENVLLTRLEAGRQMYNALLGEALRRLKRVRQSVWYTLAKRTPRNHKEERKAHFQAAREAHGFSEYALSRYATKLRQSWLGEHIDSHVAQKLAKRAFEAAHRVLLGKARRVRFKGRRGLHSLEGKSHAACIRWREDRLVWSGLELPMVRQASRDPVIVHGLAAKIKYVRLLRRKIRGKERYFAQLVCEGLPYRKPQHIVGTETVGLDIGPSTIAVVGESAAHLERFCDPVVRNHAAIRRLQRKLDRQRRANNPDCYDEQGRAIREAPT